MRISLASAGVWWALCSCPVAFAEPPAQRASRRPASTTLTVGFKQLGRTLRNLPRHPQTMLFGGFTCSTTTGIQTVIALSAQFGSEESA